MFMMTVLLFVLFPSADESAMYRMPTFEELWSSILPDPMELMTPPPKVAEPPKIFLSDEDFARLFPMPDELQHAVALWKDIFGRYTSRQIVLYDSWHCQLVYEVIDLDEGPANVTAKIKAYRAILRSLANKEKNGQLGTLTSEEERVYKLFETVTEKDRFNRAAQRQMRGQTGQYEKFLQALQTSGLYQEKFIQVFQEHELPVELIWLPFVESYFKYNAYSRAKAAGVWQFIPSTARLYGLQMTSAADERYDPFKSADAAARLLKANYALLHTWPLAITAYNHGPAGMQRAVKQVGTTDFGKIAMNYRSKSFGFYSRNYYAEFLAIAQLMRENRQKFQMIEQFPALQYEEVHLDTRMYVNDITTSLSLSSEQLAELNRDLKNRALQSKTPIPKHFRLKLPVGKKEEFIAMFSPSAE
jgi:membrane-bound lytic murein transglycosylase D